MWWISSRLPGYLNSATACDDVGAYAFPGFHVKMHPSAKPLAQCRGSVVSGTWCAPTHFALALESDELPVLEGMGC
ncbi:hypothetical protein EJ04DRAFT_510987 [Polyplosphaeria fusca]|uniref:Uncharacterized protein n=1 Tax=Polyplosphaeria fusca TaxID=682080 RepID=A0A9P4QZ12_9PLEO|nr:hypothetical protein EJ04DRAFT_510987 [Polyplosphaeria fusca]